MKKFLRIIFGLEKHFWSGIGYPIIFLIIIIVWIASTIPEKLTNEQIVEQTKFCNENGLKAQLMRTGNYNPVDVVCVPNENYRY